MCILNLQRSLCKTLTYLINLILQTGIIPKEWKQAKVIPVHKSGKRDNLNNYRPISVLPVLSKIMERAVQIQLVDFLNENSVLSQFQSGFRKKHSMETAIVYLSDRIIEHMDRQCLCGAAFIDLKKVFDLVDHKCLLHKLEHYGVRGNSLNWFKDYITTRMQRVKYDNKLSGSTEINYGVPQGSILGPLCFILLLTIYQNA